MRIPDADITRLNADTDLVGLIQSRGITLKQQGRNWTGRCPFHDDTEHANLIVTPAKGLWRCTAIDCGKSGNAIQFLEAFDGLSFRHAFELLAHGGRAAFERPPDAPRKQTTVACLPCPPCPVAAQVATLGWSLPILEGFADITTKPIPPSLFFSRLRRHQRVFGAIAIGQVPLDHGWLFVRPGFRPGPFRR